MAYILIIQLVFCRIFLSGKITQDKYDQRKIRRREWMNNCLVGTTNSTAKVLSEKLDQ